LENLKPGDLIYYGGSNNNRYLGIHHVAIYVGDGKTAEAYSTKYGVIYQSMDTDDIVMVCRPNKK
jgi:cell wall-associated NlpC family hydrolase